MQDFIKLLQSDRQCREIVHRLQDGKDCSVGGLWGSSAAFFVAAIAAGRLKTAKARPKALLVVSGIEEAEEDTEDLNTFLPGHACLFPAIENIFTEDSDNGHDIRAQRLSVIHQMLHGDVHARHKPDIVVTPIQALLQSVPSSQTISQNILEIRKNLEYPLDKLLAWLQEHRYQLSGQTENAGEYAVRGGIVDVFPYGSDVPFRIEYFGDEIESIRSFNVESQISEQDLHACRILSPDGSSTGQHKPETTSLFTYLSKDTWIILKEPSGIEDRAMKALACIDNDGEMALDDDPGTDKQVYPCHPFGHGTWISYKDILSLMAPYTKVAVSKLPLALHENHHNFRVKTADNFPHQPQDIVLELGKIIESHDRTVVFCNNIAEDQRFREIISDFGLKDRDRLELRTGHLRRGFLFSDIKSAFLSHHEIFHRYSLRREAKKPVLSRAIDSFLDLKKGDYVVHLSHGIGRYLGMQTTEEGGCKREYLLLEYDEGTKVYVPATKIELVQKYIGSSEHRPRLDKIGSKYWEVRKKRAENAVMDIAGDLLHVQALRNAKEGIAYPKDTEWQKEFEAAFIYEETPDQLQAIEALKRDMESKRPMDRLICGDVGYGKTEIAMRAAFKAVMHGKQVAVLVPTTILAQQHFRTFSERMADYPVKIGVVSRFKDRKEQKEILEKTSAGLIDILIGTHRLLQKDVYFKDLGLVVVDEEQRFGVTHKERLKMMRQMVDVLTLTATPIPRTLHMSLMGIKDISSLNTPPLGRQAVHTQIIRFDPDRIRHAIRLELNRDGQVYFVHNRVYNIERIAQMLSGIVPEARIITAHGQMDEKLLEQRMRAFVEGQADILVSTTIIESGLDIPNVNTIFINCADTFGLADMHQLRGRVGRYKHRAYAYIILPVDRPITPEAEKRVKAIEEFAELGAGFRIAMRDLEIRGAGNILGTEQHGHIAAVGYEMYCRLLEIAVRKARHEPVHEPVDVSIDLNLEAFIPQGYVPEDALKMDIYRRLNRSASFEEIKAIGTEMTDRFGEIPRPVQNLLSECELRVVAQQSKIRSIVWIDSFLTIRVADLKMAETCFAHLKRHIRVINEDTLHFRLPKKGMRAEDVLDYLKSSIRVPRHGRAGRETSEVL